MRHYSVVLLFAASVLAAPPAIFAQATPPPGAIAKPRAASSAKPDFSGVWFIDEYHRNILPNEDPPFQPWAEELFKKRQDESAHRTPDSGPDPTERCIPPGTPREMFQPFPWEIVYAKDRILILFEYQGLIRQIFMDGREHPKDLQPTYMGHSIGKWEGSTLVVDTIGLNDKTWLDPMGLPHSEEMHLTERIRRVNHNTLVDEYTIDDPKAYTKPWKATHTFILKPDWQIQEYVCAENNNVK